MLIEEAEATALYSSMQQKAVMPFDASANCRIPLDWVLKGGHLKPSQNALAPIGLFAFKPSAADIAVPEKELLISAVHFACLTVEKHLSKAGIYLPDLDESFRAVDRTLVYWSKFGGVKGEGPVGGYDCVDETELKRLFFNDTRAAKEILNRLAFNVHTGAVISPEAKNILYAVLTDIVEIPRPPEKQPTEQHRDTLLIAIADGLRERAKYSGSANAAKFSRGGDCPICGCTIAAAAINAFGLPIDAVRSSKIFGQKSSYRLKKLNLRRFFDIPECAQKSILHGTQPDVSAQVFKAIKYLMSPI